MDYATLKQLRSLAQWDGRDCPPWMSEEQAKLLCSTLNCYLHQLPARYGTRGVRFHTLNRYPSGQLYFHCIGFPYVDLASAEVLHAN